MEGLKRNLKCYAGFWILAVVGLVLFIFKANLSFSWYYIVSGVGLVLLTGAIVEFVRNNDHEKQTKGLLSMILVVLIGLLLLVAGFFSGLIQPNLNIKELSLDIFKSKVVELGTLKVDTTSAGAISVDTYDVITQSAVTTQTENFKVDNVSSYKKDTITVKSPVNYDKKVTYKGGIKIENGLEIDHLKVNRLDINEADIKSLEVGKYKNYNESSNNSGGSGWTKPPANNNNNNNNNNYKPVEPKPPVVEPEPPVVEPKPPVVEPEPPVVEPKPPVVDPEPQLSQVSISITETSEEEVGEKIYRVDVSFPTSGGSASYISGGINWIQHGNTFTCTLVRTLDSNVQIIVAGVPGKWLGNSMTR